MLALYLALLMSNHQDHANVLLAEIGVVTMRHVK